MSADRKIVLESYGPKNSCDLTWKIHHISLFDATQQAPLKSSQLSTNEEVWQLGMYREYVGRNDYYFCFNITLCSTNASYTNVNAKLSIVINGHKHLKKKLRCRLVKGQVVELWNVQRKSVLDLLKEHGVNDDLLTLDINIETWKECNTEMINCLEDKTPLNLNMQMTKMLTNQTLTDVTLQVEGKEFKAHKVVLAASSPVFAAMFKEGTKEHQDNYVNIEDIDSDVFDVFLRFLYSGQVENLDEMYFDLLAAADKYDVQPLREICIQHMTKNISVDNVVDMLALADRYDVEPIKIYAQNFITNNMASVMKTDSWASLLGLYSKVAKQINDRGTVKE